MGKLQKIREDETHLGGGLNRGTDARLLDGGQISHVENFLPSEKNGEIEKVKLHKKDYLYRGEFGADDRVSTVKVSPLPQPVLSGGDDDTHHTSRLPKFDKIERVLYLANNTYDTKFRDDIKNAPYELLTADDGTVTVIEQEDRYLQLRADIAEYLKIGCRLYSGVKVTQTTPLMFSVIARQNGNPTETTLTATLHHIDGSRVAQFVAVHPENWNVEGTDRLHFAFKPTSDVVVHAGEYYVEMTVDSSTDYYDIFGKPTYRQENIVGWAERESEGGSTDILASAVTHEVSGSTSTTPKVTVTVDQSDDPPPENDNTHSAYIGGYQVTGVLSRTWNGISTSGNVKLSLDYTARAVYIDYTETMGWDEVVDRGDVRIADGNTYVAKRRNQYYNSQPRFAPVGNLLIEPTDTNLPIGFGTSIKADVTTNSRSDMYQMQFTIPGMANGQTDNIVVQYRVHGYTRVGRGYASPLRGWEDVNGDGETTHEHLRVTLKISGPFVQVLTDVDQTVYWGLTRNTGVIAGQKVVGDDLQVTIQFRPIDYDLDFKVPCLTESETSSSIQKVHLYYKDEAPNHYWAVGKPVAATVKYPVEDYGSVGSGQTIQGREGIVTLSPGTHIGTLTNTVNDIEYKTDPYTVADDIGEVMLYQRSDSAGQFAKMGTKAITYYDPTNRENTPGGLDRVNGYSIHYFSDGVSIFAVSEPPPVIDGDKLVYSRHLNSLNETTLPIYTPKFIGQILDWTSFDNHLVIVGVGGLAVLKPTGLDESGRVLLSDIIIPNIENRVTTKNEDIGTPIDRFPPVIHTVTTHGMNFGGALYCAFGNRVFWSQPGELDSWEALSYQPFSYRSDHIKRLVSFENKLLIFTERGDLYALVGEPGSDPALSSNTLSGEKIGKVGVIDTFVVTDIGLLVFSTRDGNLWAMDGSLSPQRFDGRIGNNVGIRSMVWDGVGQRLWLAVDGHMEHQHYNDEGVLVGGGRVPGAYVWDSRTDTWWFTRNQLDDDENAFRVGNTVWKIGVTYDGDSYIPVLISSGDGVDPLNRDTVGVDNDASRLHTTTAVLISKEFDLGVTNRKQIRSILMQGRLVDGEHCTISVLDENDRETVIGTFPGGASNEHRGRKLYRKMVGAIRSCQSFRIKLSITSHNTDSVGSLFVKGLVVGKPALIGDE